MSVKQYIIAIDQGTTSTRVILVDKAGTLLGIEQLELSQIVTKSGWVEHDAEEIYQSVLICIEQLLENTKITAAEIDSIGITNQRETIVLWEKETGKPVYYAIVWQSRQSEQICKEWISLGYETMIREKTGLCIDPYFSASKIVYLLQNYPDFNQRALKEELLCGTIDSYLLYRLTNGAVHATDYSNASRTLLYNIHQLEWDEELLGLFQIPKTLLPRVMNSSGYFGSTLLHGVSVPITAMIGDQQASLFGHGAFQKGEAKVTYGTGCFMLVNTGANPILSKSGLLTTIAWGIDGAITYALEGSVFVAGSAVQWLRDGLSIITNSSETEQRAQECLETDGLYFVPTFVGMGTPYWDSEARGAMFGISRNTTQSQIIRATLDSIAYQVNDVLKAMQQDGEFAIQSLGVDGGASVNHYLMQFQADISRYQLERPRSLETSALGAAYLAGLATGFFKNQTVLKEIHHIDHKYHHQMEQTQVDSLLEGWNLAVHCTRLFKLHLR